MNQARRQKGKEKDAKRKAGEKTEKPLPSEEPQERKEEAAGKAGMPEEPQEQKEEAAGEREQWAARPGKRIRFFFICAALLLVGLAAKLAFIQIADHDKYLSVAARQQRIALEGMDRRGTIYDRNLEPLTGTEEEYVYLIKKARLDAEAKARLAAMGARRLSGKSDLYALYCCADYCPGESRWLQRERDAFVIRAPQRYSGHQPAVHVLGYVGGMDGRGVCGLEKDFDHWLSQRDKVVYAVGDASNYIIPGLGIRSAAGRECGLVTTLDLELQRSAEEILGERETHGAAIVAEVKTGEILACASAPGFQPNEVKNYLSSDGRELLNLAAQGLYPPGSVFKIVVAAAALENQIADENTLFHCKGYEEINGIRIKCSTGGKEGHGDIALRDAFVKSCNSAFIQLGEMTGAAKILDQAKAMGLEEKALTGISGEKKGCLPKENEVQGAGIGNLSIGQGKLSVTPMEICHMTQIVANGGRSGGLRLVKEIVDNGRITKLTGKDEKQVLSEKTARLLQSFMADTVKRGTANNIKEVSAGGKTGSAESTFQGEYVVHGWFTGFVPAQNPQYVITVFVERGGSGRASAAPVFQELAKKLEGSKRQEGARP